MKETFIFFCFFAFFVLIVDGVYGYKKRVELSKSILADNTCFLVKQEVISDDYYFEYHCSNNRVFKLHYDINDYVSR